MKKYNASFSHDWHSGGYEECYEYELEDSDEEEVLKQLFEQWYYDAKQGLVSVKVDGIWFEVNISDYKSKLIAMVWNDSNALEMLESEESYVEFLADEIRALNESR